MESRDRQESGPEAGRCSTKMGEGSMDLSRHRAEGASRKG